MKVYRLVDAKGNFIQSYGGRSLWEKISWIKSAPRGRYNQATIVEYELKETGLRKSVLDYLKEGTL